MWRYILLIVMSLSIACADDAFAAKPKQKRDAAKVKKEQQATRKAIQETSKKISANTQETKKQLARLNSLNSEITAKGQQISHIQSGVDSLDRHISTISDSISSLNSHMEALRSSYITSLRKMQGSSGSISTLSFIFSAESFTDAYRRVRYMQQFNRWRKRKAEDINSTSALLLERKNALDTARRSRTTALARLNVARKELESTKAETDKVVANLKSEGSSLKAVLKEKQEQARRLDRELDKLIAEEQARIERQRKEEERKRREAERKAAAKANKKSPASAASSTAAEAPKPAEKTTAPTSVAAADRALSGSFEANKGKLLFPVSGKYRIVRGFGRQKHPQLEHVETDNSGIDIEALSSKSARAVFDGTVSATFRQPGYGTIVMIRHGNYLTIYANLDGINVKNGDKVKAGQTIGTILTDPDEENRTILHFELRKERTKLNPSLWVR
jgi:septal ring factor EnvC (AmiA/AmiB activator)